MKKKFGWTASGILGFIFAPMGALFLLTGVLMWQIKTIAWKDPSDPMIFLSVFGGMGALFLLIGLVFLSVDLRRRRRLRLAYESGNCVEAEILGMTRQENAYVQSGSARMLEAAWTDHSGVVHVYRSRYIYGHAEKLLKSKTVPVYIDRYDESIGFVDVDAVLPEIRIHG